MRGEILAKGAGNLGESCRRMKSSKVLFFPFAPRRPQVEREREAEEQRQLAEALAREQEERRKQQER